MAPHLTHVGVHDHGFNNVSTYGNLWRLAREGRIDAPEWEMRFYELALKVTGAIQARRWTHLPDGGLHLLVQRRALTVRRHRSGRCERWRWLPPGPAPDGGTGPARQPARPSGAARAHHGPYSVFYGKGRDRYDLRGRTAHEILFNVANGSARGPSSQQGYSPFSTWTRGLAWAMLGFAEELEFIETLPDAALEPSGGREAIDAMMLDAARATCDRYLEDACTDGVPYWDTGAPGLARLPGWRDRPADPFNDEEPVDSSAAAIGAQGLLRLSRVLGRRGDTDAANRYGQAGLRTLDTLFDASGPYLSTDARHQGLLLHSVYHWPNGWDHVPQGSRIPRGESSMWGDYHAREAALHVKRLAEGAPYLTFFGPAGADAATTAGTGR